MKKAGPKTTPRKPKSQPSKKRMGRDVCFVIMPFGGWGDAYYETIYQPAIEAAGLEPHRADDLFRPSTIVHDIWAYTRKAKLLLADLTGKNPNVFYELGLAHALAKPAVLVAESMDEIPFDLRALRVITYQKHDPMWGQALTRKLEEAIREVLASPISAVLPAFLEVKGSDQPASVTPHQKELIEIRQELDLLKRELRSHPDLVGPPVPEISSEQAQQHLGRYLAIGMPEDTIIRRLARLGVPRDWTVDRIKEKKSGHGLRGSRPRASQAESESA